jgi:hypothetical protein
MKFFKRLGKIAQGIGRGIGSVASTVNQVLPAIAPFLGMVPQGRALLAGATAAGQVGQGIGNLAR